MRDDRIAALLGLPASDPEVERLLVELRIARRPELETDKDGEILNTQDWLLNAALGIELGFDDPATFLAEHPDEIGEHPMMLTQIYFYGEHEGVEPYRGVLPCGLSLSDGREAVRAKLATFEAMRRSYIRDTWELPRFRLIVSYAATDVRLDFLLCALRPPPLPADRDDAERLPGADRILAGIGRPLADPQLRLTLAPLKVPASLVPRQGGLVGDWSQRFGLDLRFGLVGGGKEMVLSEVGFSAPHHGGAVGWPGALPFGLTFADSPETVFARMGRSPDRLNDENFHGTAAWDLPQGTMIAEYNSMENLLVRVKVVAPETPR